MVAGRECYKCYLRSTFAHADSGGFEKPPLRKHKRCQQCVKTDETSNDNNHKLGSFDKLFRDKNGRPNRLIQILGRDKTAKRLRNSSS